MTFEKAVERICGLLADADGSQAEDAAFQIELTNEDCKGILYIAIRGGQVEVAGYDYKDHTAALILKLGDLTKILKGTLNPVNAVARGVIQITGDTEKTLLLSRLIPKQTAPKKAAGSKSEKDGKKKAAAKSKAASKAPAEKGAAKKPAANNAVAADKEQ